MYGASTTRVLNVVAKVLAVGVVVFVVAGVAVALTGRHDRGFTLIAVGILLALLLLLLRLYRGRYRL